MAQFKTYDQVGDKEDVSNIISNLTPTRTPFTSGIGTESIHNTLFQWQEDELRAVQENAQVEGFTAQDATLSPTRMRNNVTQILEKTIKVSGSADKRDTYGRAKESAYQMGKAMAEVKRDLEHAAIGTGQTKVEGDSNTARKFAGFQAQVDSTHIVEEAFGGLTEGKLLSTLQLLWNAGAEPNAVMVTGDNAIRVAEFAKASGRQRNVDAETKIVNAIDLYVSPFGKVAIQLNRFLKAGDTLVYDPADWKLAVFRNWFRETLAKDGDSTKMMVVGEFSLKHKNYKASAVIREAASEG